MQFLKFIKTILGITQLEQAHKRFADYINYLESKIDEIGGVK